MLVLEPSHALVPVQAFVPVKAFVPEQALAPVPALLQVPVQAQVLPIFVLVELVGQRPVPGTGLEHALMAAALKLVGQVRTAPELGQALS